MVKLLRIISIHYGKHYFVRFSQKVGRFNMNLNDRLARGFISGIVAGFAMNIVSLVLYYVKFSNTRFLDWAAIAIYGHKPHSFGEAIFAQIAQLVFVGVLGIIMAYLIPLLTSRNYLLRGWIFGTTVWFSLYGLILLFKLQETIKIALMTAVSDFIGASVYGLVLAESLKWLDNRVNINKV